MQPGRRAKGSGAALDGLSEGKGDLVQQDGHGTLSQLAAHDCVARKLHSGNNTESQDIRADANLGHVPSPRHNPLLLAPEL